LAYALIIASPFRIFKTGEGNFLKQGHGQSCSHVGLHHKSGNILKTWIRCQIATLLLHSADRKW